jgi:Flp pilus assembly protein TadG
MGRFWKNRKGNVGIMFAAAAVPLMLAAGMGIDFVRANRTQTILQGAADAAALAGAASGEKDEAALQKIAEDYAMANGISNAADLIEGVETGLDPETGAFTVTIKGKLNTSLMKLANVTTMNIGATSEVMVGGQALEVVLVLDTTGSMGQQGRIDALKAAAHDMVDDILKLNGKGVDVKVGIVPFGAYVNVGMKYRGESWLDVPADGTANVCWNTYPDAVSSNCRTETYTAYNDGVPSQVTGQVCDWNYGNPVQQCGVTDVKWYGCVGSRDNPLDEKISSASTAYPGLMNTYCGAPITTLSSDQDTLSDAIDALVPYGNTYIPSGLVWGWNMIDSSEPLDDAKSASQMTSLNGTKAIVLMTDGANTLSATYPKHEGNNAAAADAKTTDLCDNIKSDKITMFTVSFMVDSPSAEAVLKDCASSSDKAYDANNPDELAKAFQDIGKTLSALRITK